MGVFEFVFNLLLGSVVLVVAAPRLGMPWPALLALAGAGLAFLPGLPRVSLEPDLALALFVAPVLLDSGFDASPRDLRANWAPVGSLVLVAVALTVGAVAFTAHWFVPDMPWAAAVALGAIVAPPDAAAATAVLREVRLPHRIKVILEGESLLNDASALLIYRTAVSAAVGGMTLWSGPLLAVALVGGVIFGVALAHLYLWVVRQVDDGPASVLLQFLGTFGVWLMADRLGLSAILTVVAYAVTLGRLTPGRGHARHRRSSYAVWEVTVFVLNMLAFILMGLQLREIVERLDGRVGWSMLFAGLVILVAIGVRFAWVNVFTAVLRVVRRRFGGPLPTLQGAMVVSWCGMRGIVTLAAGLALPENFPQRDLIVFTAYSLVLGTLVLQGLTLRPLLRLVALPADDSVADEVALARRHAAQAALDSLGADRESEAGHLLALQYEGRIAGTSDDAQDVTGFGRLRRRALAAERACLIGLRRTGRIGDDAFHRVEEELDWAEAEAGSA